MNFIETEELDTSAGRDLTDYEIDYIDDDIIIIKEDNKYGLMILEGKNLTAKVLIKPMYDFISKFHDGLAIVKKDNKYGVINKLGQIISEVKYDHISPFENSLARITLNNKKGLMNTNGQVILKPKYYGISDFKYDYTRVGSNNKYGVIDESGKEIIPLKYSDIYIIDKDKFLVTYKSTMFIINSENKKQKYKFHRGVVKQIHGSNLMIRVSKSFNKFELVPLKKLKLVTDFCHDYLFIDFDNNRIYRVPKTIQYKGNCFVRGESNYLKLYNLEGEFLTQEFLAEILSQYKGIYTIICDYNSRKLYDSNKEEYIRKDFDYYSYFEYDLTVVGLNNKYGVLDSEGNLIIPLRYNDQNIEIYKKGNLIRIKRSDNRYDLYTQFGELIIEGVGLIHIYNDNIIIIDNKLYCVDSICKKYYLDIEYSGKYQLHKEFSSIEKREQYKEEISRSIMPIIDEITQKKERYIDKVDKFINRQINITITSYEEEKTKTK